MNQAKQLQGESQHYTLLHLTLYLTPLVREELQSSIIILKNMEKYKTIQSCGLYL